MSRSSATRSRLRIVRRSERAWNGDRGFTLIELLVVLVVVPLIIGAVAEALIVSFNTESTTSNRLSDSVNGQRASAYFVRDVEGATFVTTTDNSSSISTTAALSSGTVYSSISVSSLPTTIVQNVSLVLVSGSNSQVVTVLADASAGSISIPLAPFTANASYPVGSRVTFVYTFNTPEVCGPGSGATFLVGFYHPPSSLTSAATTGLDVGYWLVGAGSAAEIDRYSCTVNTDTYVATAPQKISIGTTPPGVLGGSALESLTAATDVNPSWLGYAAEAGWTPAVAQTNLAPPVGTFITFPIGTIPVASTYGFTVGTQGGVICAPRQGTTSMSGCINSPTITITTTTGPTQVTCTGFHATDFTGCTGGSGTAAIGASVTQSSISGVQVGLTMPASNYRFSLLGSPSAGTGALLSFPPGGKSPTLLTLGSGGISPIDGGGTGNCADGARANICIQSGGVVLDGGGTVQCNGQGPHSYIDVTSGSTIGSVAPPGSSNCNGLGIASSPTVPNPLAGLACFPSSLATTAGTTEGLVSKPGVWTTPLSGELVPGIYIIEGGIGVITGMAPDIAPWTSYYGGDASAGVLLVSPGPETGAGCLNATGAPVGGVIAGLVPFDSEQSSNYFGNGLLGDVWLWQDVLNSTTMTTTGSTSGGAGLAYLPSGTYSISGSSSFTTGSMIVGAIQLNGTPTLTLTGS